MSPANGAALMVIVPPDAVNAVVLTPFLNNLIVPVTGVLASVKLVLLPLIVPDGVSLVTKLDAPIGVIHCIPLPVLDGTCPDVPDVPFNAQFPLITLMPK